MAGLLDLGEIELTVDADISIDPITANMALDHNGTANINASLLGSKEEPIAMMVLGDQDQPISAHISGDKDRPISAAIEMTNLPRFSVGDIKEILKPRMKISLPGHRQLCLKIFGREIVSICYGGEGQLKIEPLNPNESNDCHISICDVDTRPFPGNDHKD